MSPAQYRTYPEPAVLAEAAATETVEAIIAAQRERGEAHALLTGGRIGIAVLRSLAGHTRAADIDRTRLHFWFGDERFVTADDRARNDGQARAALGRSMRVPDENWHAVGAAARNATVDKAAWAYDAELSALRQHRDPLPMFDIGLLSLGPDGHIASLFPGAPQLAELTHLAVPVSAAPKPPPQRVTMTPLALNSCMELLLLASGAEKAAAVRSTLDAPAGSGLDPARPATYLTTESLTWLLDADARLAV